MKILDQISYPADLKSLGLDALNALAVEIREELIYIASQRGGHLGASLGVVELTIALHRVFDTPEDLLIWDVGHQAYPHKILTGRKNQMHTIRQAGGISGFTKRAESQYDIFGAGHSSTSISAACGMAVARDLRNQKHNVIAVIGDGAISAGMAYEALNNAGIYKDKLVVVLNDNRMSISPAVGAMSTYLTKLLSSRQYYFARNIATHALHNAPSIIERIAKKLKKCIKEWVTGGNFFEELGFHYIGPIDGHNLSHLLPVLQNIKDNDRITGPVLLHVITEKGRGFESSEKSVESYHAVLPFDLKTKIQKKPEFPFLTYTKVSSLTLSELVVRDSEVVAITAAMASGTNLDAIMKIRPKQVFDVGIAEQHAVTFAAGLAAANMKPFVAIYSTFLQRAYDQIVHDVAIQSLPVRFLIDRAGVVGADGPTHAGSFDLAYICNLPNFVCMAPSGAEELSRMIATAYSICDRPSAVRYPRAELPMTKFLPNLDPLEIGRGRLVRVGQNIAIVSLGTRLQEALKVADMMQLEGYNLTVMDARFAKPIDTDLIRELTLGHKIIITVEEGVIGGFGSQVLHFLSNSGLLDHGLKFRALFLPDYFIEHNTIDAMYAEAGLDAGGIYKAIKNLCENKENVQ